jgi:membrane-associated phospholipid phosphatase
MTGAYFGLTVILLLFGWQRIPNGGGLLLLHLGIFLSILLLGALPLRGHAFFMFFRDTYPLWGLPFFYRDVGMLNHILHSGFRDAVVLKWEQALFGLFPSVWLRIWFPSTLLVELLHLSYVAYYALIPIVGFRLYLRGREELCRVFATTVMLTFFTCYLIFILFPVAGPYYVFIQNGAGTGLFPRIVHGILAGGASRGTAFPSSHVAGALTVLWMTCRFERPLIPLIGVLSAGIFFGVVYCGFHYGIDVIAGLGIGTLGSLLGPKLHRTLLRWTRIPPDRLPSLRLGSRRIGRPRVDRPDPASRSGEPSA